MEKFTPSTESPKGKLEELKEFITSWKFLTPAALAALLSMCTAIEKANDAEKAEKEKILTEMLAEGRMEQLPKEKVAVLVQNALKFIHATGNYYEDKQEGVTVEGVTIGERASRLRGAGSGPFATILVNELDPNKMDRMYTFEAVHSPIPLDGQEMVDRMQTFQHPYREGDWSISQFYYVEGSKLSEHEEHEELKSNVPFAGAQATFVRFGYLLNNDQMQIERATRTEPGTVDDHYEYYTKKTEYDIYRDPTNTVVTADHIAEMMDKDIELIQKAIAEIKGGKAEVH